MEVGDLSVTDAAPLKSKKASKSSKSSKTRTSSTNVNIVNINTEPPQAKSAAKQKAKFCMYQLQGVCRYSSEECAYSHSMEEMRHARGMKESGPAKQQPSLMAAPPAPPAPAQMQRPKLSSKNLEEHAALAPKAQVHGLQGSQQPAVQMPPSRQRKQAQWYPEYEHAPSAAAPSLAPNPFSSTLAELALASQVPTSIPAPQPAPGLGGDLEPMFLSLPPRPPADAAGDAAVWLPNGLPTPVPAPVSRPPPNLLPQQPPVNMAAMVADVAKQVAMMQEGRLVPEAVQQLSQCISVLTHKVGELTDYVGQEPTMTPLDDFANLVDMTMALQRIQRVLVPGDARPDMVEYSPPWFV
mmetsp:Transcript_18662/g.33707  ORF Transcript_18662/g.33707 Transcript_18662/m.33707 type:complete len:353 (+) Transcript_18662:59-1117(+)